MMNSLRRTQLMATAVLLPTMVLLSGLLARVAWIERHASADQIDAISRQSLATATIMPNRGTIHMNGGQVLAASVRMYNLYADPAYIMDPTGKTMERWKLQTQLSALPAGDPEADTLQNKIKDLDAQIDDTKTDVKTARDQLAIALAPLLGCEPEQVLGMIQENETYLHTDPNGIVLPSDPEHDRPRRFLWLAREVNEDFFNHFADAKAELKNRAKDMLAEAKGIKDQKTREAVKAQAEAISHALDGVGFQRTVKRIYPMGSMAAHLLGFASPSEGGIDGLEKQFNELLRGKPGSMQLVKDASRHTLMIQEQGYKPVDNGCDIWLTLDTMIQHIAETELANACAQFKAESGVAIVMDPYTGKVLAMASFPTFDAADFPRTPPEIRANRALVDPFEAGSVLKPFVMATALEHGIVTPQTMIDCHGGVWIDPTGRAVKDDYGYGVLSVEDVLVKSVNAGMAQLGWKMKIPMLSQGIHNFGFGSLTGIELPGDSKGILKPEEKWNLGTLTSVSFGYEIGVTPIQLARAFSTFTNGGYLVTPRVVEAVETSPGKMERWDDLAGAPERKQIISAKTCDTMREIMEQVYIRGTAKSAISSIYRLYGKTGTAHLAIQGAGHYATDEYNSSFMSGGPVTDPHLITVVTLHKPDKSLGHFGGIVAAPAATRIMEQSLEYLHVKPDQVEKPAHH